LNLSPDSDNISLICLTPIFSGVCTPLDAGKMHRKEHIFGVFLCFLQRQRQLYLVVSNAKIASERAPESLDFATNVIDASMQIILRQKVSKHFLSLYPLKDRTGKG
jgi:hypothetical protein